MQGLVFNRHLGVSHGQSAGCGTRTMEQNLLPFEKTAAGLLLSWAWRGCTASRARRSRLPCRARSPCRDHQDEDQEGVSFFLHSRCQTVDLRICVLSLLSNAEKVYSDHVFFFSYMQPQQVGGVLNMWSDADALSKVNCMVVLECCVDYTRLTSNTFS